MRALRLPLLLAVLSLAACTAPQSPTDGSAETGTDAPVLDVPDVPPPPDAADAPTDAPADALDATTDALDAPADAPTDALDALDAQDADASADASNADDASTPDALDAADDVPCPDASPCGTACVDLSSDPHNCGACGHDCTALPGVQPDLVRCVAGACDATGACQPDRAHCTSAPDDGCETSTTTASNCGACGAACAEPTPLCSMGAGAGGGYGCTSGCTGATPTRCSMACVDTTSDPSNCGACNNVCPVRTGSTATCTAGACGFVCNAGYHQCGTRCASDTDATACGASCTRCAAPANASATCTAGTCGFACNAGYHLCGGVCVSNTDVNACGAACTVCPTSANGTASCSSGACRITCNAGYHLCGTTCVANTDVNACGAACAVCPTSANGTTSCTFGTCVLSCASGYHNCNNTCVRNTDVANCGSSCTPCPTPPANGTATCNGAYCGVVCDAGYHACGAQCLSDTDPNSCGTSCSPCPTPSNGTVACVSGACQVTCNAGYHACRGQCLSDTDPNSCGTSCYPCPAGTGTVATCTNGVCGTTCAPGYHACLYSGCLSDTSIHSCGGSCNPCPSPPRHGYSTCDGTSCGFACVAGYTLSGDTCVPIAAPRPVAPLSTAVVTSRRPTLRWQPAAGTDGTRVEVCADRACGTVLATFDASGSSGAPGADLPARVVFWHARGLSSGAPSTAWGPTWEFTVGARTAARDASWGSVPDVNGDGFADVLASADAAPNAVNQSYAGEAYVYYGAAAGISPDLPSVKLVGTGNANEFFGAHLAGVGDLDGDGFAEMAVATSTGRLYVYWAGPQDVNSGWFNRLTLNTGCDSLAAAGDVNGDGYGDMIVGISTANNNTGFAYLYYGGPSGIPTSPSVTLTGPGGTGGYFGTSVAGAADVNADGYAEVVVGANNEATGTGRAYVYYGSATGIATTPALTLTGPDGQAGYFGGAASVAGDVNGDGYSDVLIGAYGASSRAGRAYVYLGGAGGLSATPAMALSGPTSADAYFGNALATAWDVNADGYSDLVVGAWNAGYPGAAYVFLGSASGVPSTPSSTLLPEAGYGSDFGWAVAGAGDTNGDGYSEVVVGDQHDDRVYLFSGSASGVVPGVGTVLREPSYGNSLFGSAVASAGEVLVCGPRG